MKIRESHEIDYKWLNFYGFKNHQYNIMAMLLNNWQFA